MSEHKTTTPEPTSGGSVSRRIVLRGGTAALLGVAGASALASCSTSGGQVATTATSNTSVATKGAGVGAASDYSALKGKTVGVIAAAGTSESVARIIKTAQTIGKENGFTVDTVDTNGDYKKASDTLKLFADKGYAAVLSAVVDPNLMKDGAASLQAKNIPFGGCFAGNGPGLSFDVTSNEWISGARVGTYVAQRIAASGRTGGVVIINWTPVPALVVREASWRAMLDYFKIPILGRFEVKVPGQVVDTGRITTDLLTKYPNNGQLLAVMGGWDEVGTAASQAIAKAGRKDVFAASIDGNLSAFDAIRDGAPLAVTCANDMATITSTCLSKLSAVVGGAKVTSKTIYVDAPLITKSNVPPRGAFPTGAGLTPYYEV